MKKLLIVVDMQKDFVDGSLGTKEAVEIVPAVVAKIEEYRKENGTIVFTRDTHSSFYLDTQEGKKLPIEHCIKNTPGWEIISEIDTLDDLVFEKPTFGSVELPKYVADHEFDHVELIGLCTDICVVSNALLLKAYLPEVTISLDSKCCAGVTPESHNAALTTMRMCQIEVSESANEV